jgi:hypothetical protein
VHDAARVGYPELRRHDVADELERPEKQEPLPIDNDKTLGEALRELGFVPAPGAKLRTVRRSRPHRRLTRWRKPEEQGLEGN